MSFEVRLHNLWVISWQFIIFLLVCNLIEDNHKNKWLLFSHQSKYFIWMWRDILISLCWHRQSYLKSGIYLCASPLDWHKVYIFRSGYKDVSYRQASEHVHELYIFSIHTILICRFLEEKAQNVWSCEMPHSARKKRHECCWNFCQDEYGKCQLNLPRVIMLFYLQTQWNFTKSTQFLCYCYSMKMLKFFIIY